jgi:hypothetical protein
MLTEREQKALRFYEKWLAMPAWKFVLLFGVLMWGVPVALIVTLISATEYESLAVGIRKEWLPQLIGFTIGGIIFGIIDRRLFKRKYEKLKAKNNLDKPQ